MASDPREDRPERVKLKPGDVLAGKYEIVRTLGEGGMGVVFEATHQRLRQRVAVKMLLPEMLVHDVVVQRFEREARAAAQLRGNHVARVTDVDVTAEGLPYMVMEFLDGHDLQAELDRRGRLPCGEAIEYVLQACGAMMEAHALGIVHRDLKPSNLFLTGETVHESGRIVKVLDFGISKLAADGETKLTTAETVMGTAMYMSPEQIRSSQAVDARSDVWSLGVILYELLSGSVPFVGPPTQVAAAIVTEDVPDLRTRCAVPDEVAAIVARALRRNVEERFPSVMELAMALSPYAPPAGFGRRAVDTLAVPSSRRIAATVPLSGPQLPAATVSQVARPHGDRTAPGWSQPGAPAARRGRAAVLAVLAAAVALAGGVGFFVRSKVARVDVPQNADVAKKVDVPQNADVAKKVDVPQNADVAKKVDVPQNADVVARIDTTASAQTSTRAPSPASSAVRPAPKAASRPAPPKATTGGSTAPPAPPKPAATKEPTNPLLL